jgi:hypothetical protein
MYNKAITPLNNASHHVIDSISDMTHNTSKALHNFFGNTDKMLTSLTNNKIIFTTLTVLLSLYSALIAPKLPKYLVDIFDKFYVKFILIFLLAYTSSKNPILSLLIAISILITFQTLVIYNNIDTTVDNINTNIPLSPRRAQLVQESVNKAKVHNNLAQKAAEEGNTELANAHINEVVKQDIKITNAIKAKQYLLSAEDAESKGDLVTASKHVNEAQKCNQKVISVVNIETLMLQQQEAQQNGDHDQVELIGHNINIEETNLHHLLDGNNALEEIKGAHDDVSSKHALDKAIYYNNDINKNSGGMSYPDDDVDDLPSEKPQIPDIRSPHDDDAKSIAGYSKSDYATY